MKFIPQIQPWLDSEELDQLKEVIDSTYITENEKTKAFEKGFCDITGSKHAVAYCNGTMALLAILLLLKLNQGDEVIIPDLTFVATVNAVILAGGTPVLCDIEKDGWQIDPESMKSKITDKTKAIIPVHLYGFASNMDAIMQIAKAHNLFVLEDAAEAVGVRWSGKHVGTFGDVGMMSFYANKTITTAEGGILLTDNEQIAKELYKLKNHGRSEKGIFVHESIGFNFSFSDLHAAIGLAQLTKLDKIIEKKKELYEFYKENLSDKVHFPEIRKELSPSHWFINIHVPDAESLAEKLTNAGVGTRRLFYPIHKQPCYNGRFGKDEDFPNTMRAFDTGLSLPSSYNLSLEDSRIVVEKLRNLLS